MCNQPCNFTQHHGNMDEWLTESEQTKIISWLPSCPSSWVDLCVSTTFLNLRRNITLAFIALAWATVDIVGMLTCCVTYWLQRLLSFSLRIYTPVTTVMSYAKLWLDCCCRVMWIVTTQVYHCTWTKWICFHSFCHQISQLAGQQRDGKPINKLLGRQLDFCLARINSNKPNRKITLVFCIPATVNMSITCQVCR